MYMYFTKSDNVAPQLDGAVATMNDCSRLKVSDMLARLTTALDKAIAGSKHDPMSLENGANHPVIVDSDSDQELQDEDDPIDYDSEEQDLSPSLLKHQWTAASKLQAVTPVQQVDRARMRHDLRLAKDAGFRVTHLGTLPTGGEDGFVVVSIRVSKLSISEEALAAWHMEPKQYFVVLIRYIAGYQSFDDLIGTATFNIQIRVGLSNKYKLGVVEAINAFAQSEHSRSKKKAAPSSPDGQDETHGLGRLFLRRPLEELLNDRLIRLLKYRMALGFPWLGAEEFFNDHQGMIKLARVTNLLWDADSYWYS